MKKKSAKPGRGTNGAGRQRKPVGHEGGKRVAALRGRVNTLPANGDLPTSQEVAPETVSIGEAMRRSVEELGDVIIDDQLAPEQLRQLGEAYEEVARRQVAFNAKADDAKVAKKTLEGAQEYLLDLVKEFTHPAPLPLFDGQQAADDHAQMLHAANAGDDDGDPDRAEDAAV